MSGRVRPNSRRADLSALGVLELECAQTCRGCCYDRATPTYVVRKGSWMHPQSTVEVLRGPTPTVVLVGGTGVGKSNLGNFLVGRYAFVSRNSPESVTTMPSVVDGTWFGGMDPVRVVDCAGIGDTKGDGADSSQWDAAIRTLVEVGQINALILVMKAGRFTQYEKNIISRLRSRFGPAFWRHLCIFYTGATAKPQQLNLERLAPELRRRLFQVEVERCGDCDALQDIQGLRLYGADLDPVLCCPETREKEFRLKRALKDLELEELLDLDKRIPPNVLEMTDYELDKFMTGPAAEAWIQGNYFQLGIHRLVMLKQAVEGMDAFYVGGSGAGRWREQPAAPPTQIAPALEDTEPERTGHEAPGRRADSVLVEGQSPRGASQRGGVPEDAHPKAQPVETAFAGADSPASASTAPETPTHEQSPAAQGGSPKYHPNMNSIRRALLEADTVVVRGPWVDKVCLHNGGVLPRREDLLSEAIWDADISYSKNGRHFYLL